MGYFTSHQYNDSSVVDDAVCSEHLLKDIPYFKVHYFWSLPDFIYVKFPILSRVGEKREAYQ